MTAAGLDYVSGGRFRLGLGASGPQVVEGFHGVRYDAPLGRTREIVSICRSVWRREKLVHVGSHYQIPLPEGQGSGEGKPLKLINKPVRERIPISLAALGQKNVALAAELAEGWEPIFFHPGRVQDVWGAALDEGFSRRPADLGRLEIIVRAPLAIGEDVEAQVEQARAQLALYIGGMGSRGHNFYNDLAVSYGYATEAAQIQDLFLSGQVKAAAAAVPRDLVDAVSLIGPAEHVSERLAAFAAAGASLVNVTPLAEDHKSRVRDVEVLRGLIG
jgi:F420-dependent oxidoreductase-like protein